MREVQIKKQSITVASAHHDMNPPLGHEGHDHHTMMINDFKKRFRISLILTVPILLLSEMIRHWFGTGYGGTILFRHKI